ncbi:MAG: uroporphyrinogen-III synthase [Chitinophagales bacterium]
MSTVLSPETIEIPNIKVVRSILISQPKPKNNKSAYFDLARKHNIKIDFRPFIHVEGISAKDFRKTRIHLPDYSAVIFTSRNAISHFFRICEEMRISMPDTTKYFCASEAIALYLQKFIQYRKRKVFFSKISSPNGLQTILKKHKKKETFLLPCSANRKSALSVFLNNNKFNYADADIYETVASDLSDLEDIYYDMIVFFSPLGLKSLFINFPDFKQKDTRIAAFGPTTSKAVIDRGLHLDVKAPAPESPSMTMAIHRYIKSLNQ